MAIRIMLVDDEEDALKLLSILLNQLEDVEIVGSYSNPLEALKDIDHLAVDAVFLDNHMPGMKGTEVARAIRSKRPHIQIVFISAYGEYAVEAFEIRSTDYLLKPFSKERLRDAVSHIRHTLSSQSIDNSKQESKFWIQCLGGFHIHLPGSSGTQTLQWKTRKERELCAYLIHHQGKSASTVSIIEALWPEHDLDKAKTYLYTCLSYLRKTIANHQVPIRIEKKDAGFAIALDTITVDAIEFERQLRTALAEQFIEQQLFDQFIQYTAAIYMEGSDYDWAYAKNYELNQLSLRVIHKAYEGYRSNNQVDQAIECLQRILAIAPDSEKDGRELIAVYLETGNRNEALRVYQQLEKAVYDHLEAELEEETVRLIHPIRDSAHSKNRVER